MASFNASSNPLDFLRGCTVDFDLNTGLSKKVETGKRYLSQMKGMFADEAALEKKIAEEGTGFMGVDAFFGPESTPEQCVTKITELIEAKEKELAEKEENK